MLAKYGKHMVKPQLLTPQVAIIRRLEMLGATEGSWEQSLLSRLKSSMPASSSKFKTSTKPVTNYLKLHLLTLHLLFPHVSLTSLPKKRLCTMAIPGTLESKDIISPAAKAAGASKLKSSCSDFKGKVSMSSSRTFSYWTSDSKGFQVDHSKRIMA